MANFPGHFEQQYQSHLKHLKLKSLQPKTINAYARGMRRIGGYFSYQVDALSGLGVGKPISARLPQRSAHRLVNLLT